MIEPVAKPVVRTEVGRVKRAKMQKTIVVEIARRVPHPKYGKRMKLLSSRFAHDETNECKEGDIVEIKECRPISRHKSWTLVKIVKTASAT
ncbi:MAG: 30S ribosomal protein S17 [Gammaproteobacteria bacterium]|nr:30S ribosomal protein S17 [Gammaproteobacteria bacterium]